MWRCFSHLKIVLRMFAEASAPVRTPSYMPRLTTFFWFGDSAQAATAYFSTAFLHHSNGQSGAFYKADGPHNHDGGSFGTNYFEFAAYPIFWKRPFFGWSSITFEWHPRWLENSEQRSTYGNTRLRFATTQRQRVLCALPDRPEIRDSAALDRRRPLCLVLPRPGLESARPACSEPTSRVRRSERHRSGRAP
jgi:hypothetical protein